MPRPLPVLDEKPRKLGKPRGSHPSVGIDYSELPVPAQIKHPRPRPTLQESEPTGMVVRPFYEMINQKYVDLDSMAALVELTKAGHRSTNYKTFFAPLAYHLAMLSATDARICTILNIAPQIFQSWRDPNHNNYIPEFARALLAGRDLADSVVAQSLFARAVGFTYESEKVFYNAREDKVVRATITEYVPPDPTAAMNWLRNRQRGNWQTRIDEEGVSEAPATGLPPLIHINILNTTK